MISRRRFVTLASLGSAGIAGALSACGNDDGTGTGTLTVVQRFPQMLVPGAVRAPVSLANFDGLLTVRQARSIPDVLTARLVDDDTGVVVGSGLSAAKHSVGLATPYWPFRFRVETPGIYSLILDEIAETGAAIQVSPRDEVAVPLVGDVLPPFDTPTFDDPRGVNPICTRRPDPCPLHDLTLTDALARGKPVVYLVGTPAYCATGTCSPALEGVLAVREQLGDAVTFVHSEIYTDDTISTVSPAVLALNMTYEPALFITDATGTLVDRLDAVFDEVEVLESLEANSLVS